MSTGQWLILLLTFAAETFIIGFAVGEAHSEIKRKRTMNQLYGKFGGIDHVDK